MPKTHSHWHDSIDLRTQLKFFLASNFNQPMSIFELKKLHDPWDFWPVSMSRCWRGAGQGHNMLPPMSKPGYFQFFATDGPAASPSQLPLKKFQPKTGSKTQNPQTLSSAPTTANFTSPITSFPESARSPDSQNYISLLQKRYRPLGQNPAWENLVIQNPGSRPPRGSSPNLWVEVPQGTYPIIGRNFLGLEPT